MNDVEENCRHLESDEANTAVGGVWVTYSWNYDAGKVIQTVYHDELDALRAAVDSGYLKVGFLAFGESAEALS